MPTVTVKTQEELDKALAACAKWIIIDSPSGVLLRINEYGSSTVEACGTSTVEAYGSSTVEACGTSTVEAYDSSTVEACGTSTVEAYDSSTVRACDTSTVRAYDTSTVRASSYVAVHVFSAQVTHTGGVIIDVNAINENDPTVWCSLKGVHVNGEKAIVYKAVSPSFHAGQSHRSTEYQIGTTVTADDWEATRECGNGLHFSATPRAASRYYQGPEDQTEQRFLDCEVNTSDMIPLGDKCKAPSCVVLHEVTIDASPVEKP